MLTIPAAVQAVRAECEAGETVADAVAFIAQENGLNAELLGRKVRESYGENVATAYSGVIKTRVENEAVRRDREEREERAAEAARQERIRKAREAAAARWAAMTPAQREAERARAAADARRINELLNRILRL